MQVVGVLGGFTDAGGTHWLPRRVHRNDRQGFRREARVRFGDGRQSHGGAHRASRRAGGRDGYLPGPSKCGALLTSVRGRRERDHCEGWSTDEVMERSQGYAHWRPARHPPGCGGHQGHSTRCDDPALRRRCNHRRGAGFRSGRRHRRRRYAGHEPQQACRTGQIRGAHGAPTRLQRRARPARRARVGDLPQRRHWSEDRERRAARTDKSGWWPNCGCRRPAKVSPFACRRHAKR